MLRDEILQRPTEYAMLQDGVLQRPTEFPMLRDGVLTQPTEYLLQLRKDSHGRHSTSAFCANIVTADIVRDATGWSTTTADIVPDTTEWNTITADIVLATMEEALPRPIEYPMRFYGFIGKFVKLFFCKIVKL